MMRLWMMIALVAVGCTPDSSHDGSGLGDAGGHPTGAGGGEAGMGGAGGDPGDMDFAGTGYTQAQLAQAMLHGPACQGREVWGEITMIAYLLNSQQGAARVRLGELVDCLIAADDCVSAALCSHVLSTDVACDRATFEGHCDGDVRVLCDRTARPEYTEHRTDCRDDLEGNSACSDAEGWARCVSPGICEGASQCQGDVVVSCDDGVPRHSDCALAGRVCMAYAGGGAACVVAESGCVPCDGGLAQACNDGVISAQVNCASLGLVCAVEDDGEGQCQAASPACGDGEKRCVGTVAEVCVWGAWWPHDCSLVGATCANRDGEVFCDLP